MHFAAFERRYPLRFGHDEFIACPEAGFFGIGIIRRGCIPAIIARIKGVIWLPPIVRNCADRVFDHIWSLSPFGKTNCCFKQLKCVDKGTEAFILKPSRATYSNMSAGRKGKEYLNRRIRRQPFPDISTNTNDVAVLLLAREMVEIHAVAKKTCFGPGRDHISRVVEQADDNLGIA